MPGEVRAIQQWQPAAPPPPRWETTALLAVELAQRVTAAWTSPVSRAPVTSYRPPSAAAQMQLRKARLQRAPAAQPESRRRIQLDNARVLPLLMTQTPPVNVTRAQLERLRVPAAVAYGDRTRPAFATVSQAAARATQTDPRFIVRGATHMWPEEAPGEFVSCVRSFIDAH